jgi:hypothetical protein
VSENMDSSFIKQPESGKRVSDIGASSSTEENHDFPAVKNGEKISNISRRSVLLVNS